MNRADAILRQPAAVLGTGALLLVAVSTLHSKLAGVLWGLAFLSGGVLAWLRRPWPPPDEVDRAASVILLCVGYALVCWLALALVRGELFPALSAEPNAGLRLVIGALAAAWIVRVGFRGDGEPQLTGLANAPLPASPPASPLARPALVAKPELGSHSPERITHLIIAVLATATLVAAAVALLTPRERLPSNAIAWASSVGFLACLLIVFAVDRETAPWQRWLAGTGSCAGLIAIGASQVRGAYAVALWLLGVVLWGAYRRHAQPSRLLTLACLGVGAFAACLAWSWWHPSDPLRMREISMGIERMRTDRDFNSQTGSRIYLFALGWQTFREAPLVGVGVQERLRRIHASGLDGSPETARGTALVRELGHVQNAYLHHSMDGGLVGLSAFLATLLALLWAAGIIRARSSVAAVQFYGLAWVHAVTNITNVNFAHNYYALMFSISAGLILVNARVAGRPGQGAALFNRR